MPKKGKKKGGEKGKGKKGGKKTAAKAAAAAEAEAMLKVCKKFVKSYQLQCGSAGSVPSHRILRDIRACVENERPLPKVATGRENADMSYVRVSYSLSWMCKCAARR